MLILGYVNFWTLVGVKIKVVKRNNGIESVVTTFEPNEHQYTIGVGVGKGLVLTVAIDHRQATVPK